MLYVSTLADMFWGCHESLLFSFVAFLGPKLGDLLSTCAKRHLVQWTVRWLGCLPPASDYLVVLALDSSFLVLASKPRKVPAKVQMIGFPSLTWKTQTELLSQASFAPNTSFWEWIRERYLYHFFLLSFLFPPFLPSFFFLFFFFFPFLFPKQT